ncbi:MAG: hypothetical protein IIB60_04140 [Planctomycetes bacterium]|nr:hypothetical protein [Planctomycetota bacterium]
MSHLTRCVVGVCLLLVLSGCTAFTRAPRSTVVWNYPHATEQTLTQSSTEHYRAVSNVPARDARALIEDLDLLFLTERPSRLNRWHDR